MLALVLILAQATSVTSQSRTRTASSGVRDASGRRVATTKSSPWSNPLPKDIDEYKRVLKGENGNNCRNTWVDVQIQNAEDVQSQETIERAVASAVIENYDPKNPFVAAQDTADAILTVIAKAIGSVQVKVNSGNQGCWGIGFGRAKARAFANGTATAIAKAISKVAGDNTIDFEAITSDSATNVSEIVENVAAALSNGNGKFADMYREVEVTARVDVMACAIAKAYAQIKGNDAYGTAQAQIEACEAGKILPHSSDNEVNCRCKKTGNQPKNCGKHGINGAMDDICYVSYPAGCSCSQASKRYPGEAWRYCGNTLGEMQVYANIEDAKNGIAPTKPGYGFCNLNSKNDLL